MQCRTHECWLLQREIARYRRLALGGRQLGRLFRGGGLASVAYTVKVKGMSDSQFKQVRAIAGHALFGKARGRCRTMEFQLSHCPRADPTFVADEYPLVYWLRALHANWVKHRAMALAFMQAQNQATTWRSVRGPVGAVVMTPPKVNVASYQMGLLGYGARRQE